MLYTCQGCHGSWRCPSDLTQHQLKTRNSRCLKAATHHRANRSSRQTATTSLSTSTPNPPQTAGSSSSSGNTSQTTFAGDFFGQDYIAEDFPGFGNGDEKEEDEDEDEEESLNPGWEPDRPPRSTTADFIDPPTSQHPERLLRHLPAERNGIHVQKFGGLAGAMLPNDHQTGVSTASRSGFAKYQAGIPGNKTSQWAPFISHMDWEVARWAKLRGSGSTAFSDLLAIEGVAQALGLSYRNSLELNELIDKRLPSRRPAFARTEVIVGGEAFDLYARPILDCIRALYGNPEHSQYLCFTPERHYTDADRTMRLYHDLNTGRCLKALEKDKPGATIIPLIISSDKTQITLFRNKSAYPVYMTIGNLPKEIRRKPSQQGQILLAYLPTSRLEHVTNKSARRRMVTNLFHACMTHILAPLKEAGLEGIVMQSGDGVRRRCHPILAAYVGDYPEQCLVTTCYYGDCPCCETERNQLEEYPKKSPY
ncbi:hypothetical protein EV360DRAFT_97749 [Lentinula raphanica]|nr:hypothetical protein EV360DRAFT_97749 [Lentinula raphanica]